MIRKRLLSACLALALCLGLLPVTALAVEGAPNSLYVGDQQVINGNNTTFWTTDKSTGGLTECEGNDDNWNVKYDPNTATLTLRGATIQGGSTTGSAPFGSGIYAPCRSNQSVALTIELIGTNTITGNYGIYVDAQQGETVGTNASLLIRNSSDNGILEVSGSSHGIYVKSGTGDASLNINDASVVAKTTQTYSSYAGVCVQSGASATEPPNISLSVDGGSLTASASEGNDGIQFYVGNSSASATTSLTVTDNAIVDARNGGISASRISETLPTPTPTGDNRSGIVFDGSTGTVYGSVALQDDLTIGAGETLTIGKDASLTVPDGKTLTNKGTVTTDGGTLTNNGTINNSGTLPDDIDGTAPPSITTTSLAGGAVGTAYNATLGASGENITWTWAAVTGSSLPPGLELSTSGVISGTPTTQGTSNFTVTATNSGGSDSKEFTLSIDEQGTIPVTGVSLNKSETTLTVGGTETLTATVLPEGATNKSVTWSSNAPSVATVDENGVVTAVGSGTATITVTTEDGNYTAVCTVYVAPYIPPVPSYLIQLPEVEGGTVTADRAAARQGTEVTLTVTPDEGFALASLTVTDFFGNQVDISRNSDGTYSFVMPASQVTVSAVFAPAQLPFTDVTEANWYYDEVYYVWANGLMQGTSATTFGPNVDTTRAMVVTILWRLEGEPASGYDMDYSDVAGGAWYAGAVRWATEHGIVNGSEGQFYPGGIVTREQLAAMLYRYAQYKGYDLTAGGDLSGFADAGAVSGWAETSLAWAVGQGLLQGSDSQVDPQGSAIRAQTAAILMRFCENTAN